jgi:hypothetical protein
MRPLYAPRDRILQFPVASAARDDDVLLEERAQPLLHLAVADHDEAPVLEVAPARGPNGGVEQPRDHVVRDLTVLHPPHRAGGVEGFDYVHGPLT